MNQIQFLLPIQIETVLDSKTITEQILFDLREPHYLQILVGQLTDQYRLSDQASNRLSRLIQLQTESFNSWQILFIDSAPVLVPININCQIYQKVFNYQMVLNLNANNSLLELATDLINEFQLGEDAIEVLTWQKAIIFCIVKSVREQIGGNTNAIQKDYLGLIE
ncbi:Conserved_hypothetical protein [Hexamita inflata]|uniref:Uncharacterized protein n=1 Tax=Hexamita inflata TaxID=28002 RepID=A0AA86P5C3_9EUKA|nr:Conserved hypothetical protein [Hexamita inflata]